MPPSSVIMLVIISALLAANPTTAKVEPPKHPRDQQKYRIHSESTQHMKNSTLNNDSKYFFRDKLFSDYIQTAPYQPPKQ